MDVRIKSDGVQMYTGPVPERPVTYGMLDMAVPLAWRDATGRGVVVGVIDTGAEYTHNFLKDTIIEHKDFTGTRPDGIDDNGHGTHCSGIIKAVAPDVRIVSAKVLAANGEGSWDSVAQALRWMADWTGPSGERISAINLSLGGPDSSPALHDAIKYAEQKDVLPVCAAGNDGDENPDTDEMGYPARYPESLAVAALGASWERFFNRPANFTSSGPKTAEEGVDIASFGWNVVSSYIGNTWATLSGTSMATPHIVGAIALLVERYRRKHGRSPSQKGLYEAVIQFSQPIFFEEGQVRQGINVSSPDWNNLVGAGRFTFMPYAELVRVQVPIGQKKIILNDGVEVPLDTAAIIDANDRTLIPLRALAEAYNHTVGYDPVRKVATSVGYRTTPLPPMTKLGGSGPAF